MTAIVGLVDDRGHVWIGGDSAAGADTFAAARKDTKVWSEAGWVFGFTTSFRMGQILQYSLKVPTLTRDEDVYRFMVTKFIDAVRQCLKDGGYAASENGREEGGTFLVGTAGRLFSVESDFQVAEWGAGYHAVGSGAEVALGALFATDRIHPQERVFTALDAAYAFGAYVRPPFTIVTTAREGITAWRNEPGEGVA